MPYILDLGSRNVGGRRSIHATLKSAEEEIRRILPSESPHFVGMEDGRTLLIYKRKKDAQEDSDGSSAEGSITYASHVSTDSEG